ncbi:MAG TPA: DUF72 domain-containing protein [Candidatus Acidoferrum sp.]|jgi:uncharacterized protein YecE (DUF72 family)
MASPGKVRIGISGWTYKPWRGIFYPEDLKQKSELEYASRTFNSIEINGTFYSLQRPTSFERWAAATPDDFVFSVKAPRFITHIRRLKDAQSPVANFLASGIFRLGAKLGPILWQLPPNFQYKPELLEQFLKLLPHNTDEAAVLAKQRDSWLKGREAPKADATRPMRHAIEIRHSSFATPEFINLLRKYDVSLVCADTVEWPRLMDVTSDFMYCRLHGSEVLYASGYDDAALDQWTTRVAAWARGGEPEDAERVIKEKAAKRPARDVFVYFDNDAKVRAPFDAKSLTERINKVLAK